MMNLEKMAFPSCTHSFNSLPRLFSGKSNLHRIKTYYYTVLSFLWVVRSSKLQSCIDWILFLSREQWLASQQFSSIYSNRINSENRKTGSVFEWLHTNHIRLQQGQANADPSVPVDSATAMDRRAKPSAMLRRTSTVARQPSTIFLQKLAKQLAEFQYKQRLAKGWGRLP